MDHFISTITEILEEKIKESIQKEISLLREFLSNSLEEEMSLKKQDKVIWTQVMQNRFILIQKIKGLRNDRASKELSEKDPSCSTLFLTDQLLALLQKIHHQTNCNENLLTNAQHLVAIPEAIPYPAKLATVTNRRTTLMTLP
jgi:hypothetical protein